MQSRSRRIGILVFDAVQALDVTGPADAFAAAERGAYEVVLVGTGRGRLRSESGIRLQADCTLATRLEFDTVIVPGGRGLRANIKLQACVGAWVRARAPRTRRIASVCTGAFGVARSGLLDGRRVTTHWNYAAELARAFPRLRVEANAILLRDGRFYSSAGVTASIDLALALISEDFGPAAAVHAARQLVVYMQRSGGQEQYSAPLRAQAQAPDRLGEAAAWAASHLREPLAVEALAARAHLSPRQFSRAFRRAFQTTPAAYVQRLRLDESRRLLGERGSRVEAVASAVGYASADVFRRAFERQFGLPPSAFRGRFQVQPFGGKHL